ncbi:MAG: transaldolase, partial [Dehalococcoidia bacterium]|nr:transaldolase [Dehalococcoidia bacterium]
MDETLQNAQDEALRQAQDEAMQELQRQDFVGRIWKRDHTLWKDDPREIANRLGWLDVAAQMTPLAPDLESFAREVKEEGVRHIVLLGMGGSSLGPAVLRGAFGSAAGYPELVVLDSTLPDVVAAVERSLDLTRTVFLVSSKSGDTIESISLYRYFRSLLDKAIGVSQAGKNFVAITDPGSPLVALAEERGFRRVFLNPPDIGGRYSVLSYFGLAPAALMDVNIREMLDRAKEMGDRCRSVDIHNNPGLWLGAAIGAMARQCR